MYCPPHSTCVPEQQQTYTCECDPGYYASGSSCVDINECTQNICGNATCVNQAGTYECVCPQGYEWNGVKCIVNSTQSSQTTTTTDASTGGIIQRIENQS